jgi:hypothetical protein
MIAVPAEKAEIFWRKKGARQPAAQNYPPRWNAEGGRSLVTVAELSRQLEIHNGGFFEP